MNDWLGEQIAAEEHRQGLPVSDRRGHCRCCDHAAGEARRARCTHEETITDVMLCGPRMRICIDCGHTWEESA